jgi:hypothetical protein
VHLRPQGRPHRRAAHALFLCGGPQAQPHPICAATAYQGERRDKTASYFAPGGADNVEA